MLSLLKRRFNDETAKEKRVRFEILKSTSRGYWWRIKATNGQILASSEIYTSKDGCQNAIATVKAYAKGASTYDLTDERSYAGRFLAR